MTQFIDRRNNNKNKSLVNRQRFIRRFKNQIKKAVSETINGRSITNIEQGEVVNIPAKDLNEPNFRQGPGGEYEQVLPGNKEYSKGDTIKRPEKQSSGLGQNSTASNTGQGEDNFAFEISREEFLELFFDDLELPHLIKKQLHDIKTPKSIRAGFTSTGVPTNINISRSMRRAVGRKLALRGAGNAHIKKLEQKLLIAQNINDTVQIKTIQEQINQARAHLDNIPFIDSIDIKYNNKIIVQQPSSGAVMFCIMDVSGSMDEVKKDVAKRFFILLYLFLTRVYEKIEVVFIRHHTSAKEVNEEEFFYSKETGGTVVSSALELMSQLIQTRYSKQDWNIYAAQASDGDNWNNDSPRCRDIIVDNIMPNLQYFSYIEIMPRHHQSLWEAYQGIAQQYNNFTMQHIKNHGDIYPVFRTLFKKQAKV